MCKVTTASVQVPRVYLVTYVRKSLIPPQSTIQTQSYNWFKSVFKQTVNGNYDSSKISIMAINIKFNNYSFTLNLQ